MSKETKGLEKVLEEFDTTMLNSISYKNLHISAKKIIKGFIIETYHTAKQDRDEELKSKIEELSSEKLLVGYSEDGTINKPIKIEYIRKQDILNIIN